MLSLTSYTNSISNLLFLSHHKKIVLCNWISWTYFCIFLYGFKCTSNKIVLISFVIKWYLSWDPIIHTHHFILEHCYFQLILILKRIDCNNSCVCMMCHKWFLMFRLVTWKQTCSFVWRIFGSMLSKEFNSTSRFNMTPFPLTCFKMVWGKQWCE
jgi:hypothetical protein